MAVARLMYVLGLFREQLVRLEELERLGGRIYTNGNFSELSDTQFVRPSPEMVEEELE